MKATIKRYEMMQPGDTVVAAVSGGADSTLLLHGLNRVSADMKIRVVVATLDHGLRPSSAEDVGWVRAQCAKLGVPCHAGRIRLSPGAGIETRARVARMRFLEAVRNAHGARFIALGHSRSDRVETMLIHLHRGSGMRGLAAMGPVDGIRIRPLIELDREAIRRALRRAGIAWREDESNTDINLLRNRVRHTVVPILRDAFDGSIEAAWAGLGDRLRRELGALRKLLDWELAGVAHVRKAGVQLPADWWRDLDEAMAQAVVLRLMEWVMGSTYRMTGRLTEDMVHFFQGTGKGEWRPFRQGPPLLVRSGAWTYLLREVPKVAASIPGPGRYPGWFQDLVVSSEPRPVPVDATVVDLAEIPFPWEWTPVDTGSATWANPERTASPASVMKNRRWGWFERKYAPVLHQAGAVFWIPGDKPGQINRGWRIPVAVYTVPAIGYNPQRSSGFE